MKSKIELDSLKKAKSLSDCVRIIKGVNYINGRMKKEVIDYCFTNYNLDILKQIEQNKKNYCMQCGKEIAPGKKFCNSSCAAKFNNIGRVMSDETKKKISDANRKEVINKITNEPIRNRKRIECICKTCGNLFYSYRKSNYCSPTCAGKSEDVKEKIRKRVYDRIKNGTFSGWKTRNVKSYAEMFWEEVLKRNNIEFKREDFGTKKYFLDFLIEKNGNKID